MAMGEGSAMAIATAMEMGVEMETAMEIWARVSCAPPAFRK